MPLHALAHVDPFPQHVLISTKDDLGWLCGWGGHPLVAWEDVGLSAESACVVDHVDYWLWKENEHIYTSDARLRACLPPLQNTDPEIAQLHHRVCNARWNTQNAALQAHLRGAVCCVRAPPML